MVPTIEPMSSAVFDDWEAGLRLGLGFSGPVVGVVEDKVENGGVEMLTKL